MWCACGAAATHPQRRAHSEAQKTGTELPPIPVHPHLQAVLNATPSEHLTFLVTATGKPHGGKCQRAISKLLTWATFR